MVQAALLLLACALSRYLWEIDTAIASIVLGATLLSAIFYAFTIVAGSASVSCPYKTPGIQILRYLWRKVPNRSTLIAFFDKIPLASHVCARLRSSLATKASPEPHLETRVSQKQRLDREATALDFRCAAWILQTSLDRGTNALTLKFLGSVLSLPGFEVTIVTDCFNILVSCVSGTDSGGMAVIGGLEQLAATAATCLLGSVSRSLIVDPESNKLKDLYQWYRRAFPPTVDLRNLPFYHTMKAIRRSLNRRDYPEALDWKGIDFSTPENLFLAHHLVKIAWLWYRRLWPRGQRKVPRWVLRFSSYSLLSYPEPPASVIADCLMIIAIDLGCDVSESDIRNLDKRYVCVTHRMAYCPDRPLVTLLGISYL